MKCLSCEKCEALPSQRIKTKKKKGKYRTFYILCIVMVHSFVYFYKWLKATEITAALHKIKPYPYRSTCICTHITRNCFLLQYDTFVLFARFTGGAVYWMAHGTFYQFSFLWIYFSFFTVIYRDGHYHAITIVYYKWAEYFFFPFCIYLCLKYMLRWSLMAFFLCWYFVLLVLSFRLMMMMKRWHF